ncbi:uncharacterized protein At4g14450, chloroplastic-like [Vicia villosa]|uniref:uncharacterized protein At4g14450, chloroplastic-like n=1 Tax=Vicia villosa TaxID=3911 RepID=UPI00273C5147|nr:uncharacterized protein At4g14450, chloroplastic-like [Vicia villosa]
MADTQRNRTRPAAVGHRQPNRLQSRAPSSLQINRTVDWNVAIPLLSPVDSSPPPQQLPLAAKREELKPNQQQQRRQIAETEKIVFKKWQHPAAPFCYEATSVVPPFC